MCDISYLYSIANFPLLRKFIIGMTKLLDADWLRGVQLFR